jgi:hypothetical protein
MGNGTGTVVITVEHIVQASLAAHRNRQTFLESLRGQNVLYFDGDSAVIGSPDAKP